MSHSKSNYLESHHLASHHLAHKPLYTYVCNYGTVEYLDHIKKTREYTELLMELDKDTMKSWASNEWGHELKAIKGSKFEDAQGNTISYGEVAPKQPIKNETNLSIELVKRIITRSMLKYIPKKHTLFYLWLKDIEETEEGQEFVEAIKIYCINPERHPTDSYEFQEICFRTLKWLRAFFYINNPEYE